MRAAAGLSQVASAGVISMIAGRLRAIARQFF